MNTSADGDTTSAEAAAEEEEEGVTLGDEDEHEEGGAEARELTQAQHARCATVLAAAGASCPAATVAWPSSASRAVPL